MCVIYILYYIDYLYIIYYILYILFIYDTYIRTYVHTYIHTFICIYWCSSHCQWQVIANIIRSLLPYRVWHTHRWLARYSPATPTHVITRYINESVTMSFHQQRAKFSSWGQEEAKWSAEALAAGQSGHGRSRRGWTALVPISGECAWADVANVWCPVC